jgi:ADP-heptose:LPS heptosyltransferase
MNKKILIIKLGAIGDVVHTTVIQQVIKEKYPDCEIHFLTSDLIAPLLQNDPNLAKVYGFESDKKDNLLYLIQLGLKFRKEKFDIIINLQNSLRNKFFIKIANPKIVASRSKQRVHAIDAFFNTAKEFFDEIERPENLQLFISGETLKKIEKKIENYKKPIINNKPRRRAQQRRQGRIWRVDFGVLSQTTCLKNIPVQSSSSVQKKKEATTRRLLDIPGAVLFSESCLWKKVLSVLKKLICLISGTQDRFHMASALNVTTLGIMGSTRCCLWSFRRKMLLNNPRA